MMAPPRKEKNAWSAWGNLWLATGCATCLACTHTTENVLMTGSCGLSLALPVWSLWTRLSWLLTKPTEEGRTKEQYTKTVQDEQQSWNNYIELTALLIFLDSVFTGQFQRLCDKHTLYGCPSTSFWVSFLEDVHLDIRVTSVNLMLTLKCINLEISTIRRSGLDSHQLHSFWRHQLIKKLSRN